MKKLNFLLDENNIVIDVSNYEEIIDIPEEVAPEMIGVEDKHILYDEENNTHNNVPILGYFYDENLNAFVPPKPNDTYILNTKTYEWEPNPNIFYDLHNNGVLYRYLPDQKCWINV